MIYILVATKAEAQAFVDKYKLQDYKNEFLHVEISGIGSANMYEKALHVVELMKDDDKLVNVGICGADKKYNIGKLLENPKNLTCVDNEVSDENIYEIVDMESAGFIKASLDVKNRYIYKVVSDNFEPKSVTKDKAKKLIFNKIDEIMEKINK